MSDKEKHMRLRLRTKRVAAGLTSAEASEAVGTVKQYWSLLETGRQRGTIKLWRRIQVSSKHPRRGDVGHNQRGISRKELMKNGNERGFDD